jgi:hypothetical protein
LKSVLDGLKRGGKVGFIVDSKVGERQLLFHRDGADEFMGLDPRLFDPPENWVELVRVLLEIQVYQGQLFGHGGGHGMAMAPGVTQAADDMLNGRRTLHDVIAVARVYLTFLREQCRVAGESQRSAFDSRQKPGQKMRQNSVRAKKKSTLRTPAPLSARKGDKTNSSFAVPAISLAEPEDATIYSRVLKDIFHVMNRAYLPRNHGAFLSFYWAFRDAIFIPFEEDVAAVLAVFRDGGEDVELSDVMDQRWNYFIRRVRR